MAKEIVPGITAEQEVAFGKPVIAGTRVPVALVLGQLAEGVSEEEILTEYSLTSEQIRAALRYAAWLTRKSFARPRNWPASWWTSLYRVQSPVL